MAKEGDVRQLVRLEEVEDVRGHGGVRVGFRVWGGAVIAQILNDASGTASSATWPWTITYQRVHRSTEILRKRLRERAEVPFGPTARALSVLHPKPRRETHTKGHAG